MEQLRGQQVGTSAAVYFVARNDTGGALELTGVRVLPGTEGATATAAAGLHETIDDNGVLRMRPVESWRLPAGETLELRPGGRHLMVTDLAESEEPDSLQLELRFEAVAVLDTSDLLLTVTVPLGRPGVDLEPHHG